MSSSPKVILEGLPDDNIRRVVWWYCDLEKNESAQSEPKVKVCCRKFHDDNNLGDEFFYYPAGITNLGQVPLGTIFRGHNKIGQLDKIDRNNIVEEIFQLDFDDNAWEFATSWGKISEKSWIIPPFSYSLPDRSRHLPTKIASFHFTSTPFGLIIPCLEMFSRLYGRSQYVKRILLTNPFDAAIDKLIVPDVEEALADTWQVTMDKHCYDGDGIFLAHLRHDPVTEKRVRSIWGQLEGAQDTRGTTQIFPEIGPWHDGAAQLQVKGLWLDKDKTRFLALQILRWSDPGGAEIYLDRQNTNLVTGPLKKLRDKTTWPRLVKRRPKEQKELLLRYSEEPGTGLNAREILDEPGGVLGQKRKVTKIVRTQQGDREKGTTLQQDSADQCSGGEAHGEKEDVDQATIHTPEMLESEGTLRNVWETLVSMAAAGNNPIKSIASILPDGSASIEPIMLPCPAAEIEKKMTDSKRYWHLLTLDPKQPRNILVARIETENEIGYIMEIQRRVIIKNGKQEESPTYRGLAFRLNDEDDLKDWIKIMLVEVVKEMGIVHKITNNLLMTAKTFNHLPESKGGLKRSVMNGLSKIMTIAQDKSEVSEDPPK